MGDSSSSINPTASPERAIMRFSTLSLLALPVLAAAQESPLDQAKVYFDKFMSFIPNPNKAHTPEAAAAKAGGRTLNILTLSDWEQTIRSSVKPAATTPEEWWVLVTGGNTTCFGQCTKMEKAFNETALLWSVNPAAPLGYFFWVFAVIPSWLFMIGISFASRSIMSNRAAGPQGRRPAAPATAAR